MQLMFLVSDMIMDWKQNSGEVIVKLNPGPGAFNVDELKAEFTDTDCVINFPGIYRSGDITWCNIGTLLDFLFITFDCCFQQRKVNENLLALKAIF